MGHFTGPLIAEQELSPIKVRKWYTLWLWKHNGIKETWVIHEPFSYIADNGDRVDVEKGYRTDFASTPQLAWSLGFSKDGPWAQPAVVHDKAYGEHLFPRHRCDEILYEAMGDTKIPTPDDKRKVIYEAVHRFGWMFY